MKKQHKSPAGLPKIVYDEHGNPIDISHLHPKTSDTSEQSMPSHQMVYVTRPHEPVAPVISETVRQKHEESKRAFPYLNLSEGEYIISAIKRHPIGLFQIWAVVALALVLISIGIVWVMSDSAITAVGVVSESAPWLGLLLLGMMVFVFLGGIMATIIYEGNRFFLTNESVTQHIQLALFSKKEQTISLTNIEDASFRQHGIVQSLLNYGSIRLSTEGDETTYRFNFVSDPQRQVALLNDAVEAFKMGRPVDANEDLD